jgi:hypothetical protein
MKHLLYIIPLFTMPLLFTLAKGDKPNKPAQSAKAKPPIDAAVPDKLETATFALG